MLRGALLIVLGIVLMFTPVSSETIVVGVYEVYENSTFSVPVIAKNLTNIAGFDISLQYDPDVIEFVSYSVGSSIGQNFHFDNVDNAEGNARFIVVSNRAINSSNITVIVLNFKAVGAPGSQTELRLYAELGRVIEGEQMDFQTIIPECVSGTVYIKSQFQTEPAKTPTPTPSPVSGGGGGYVDVTTPSPITTSTPTPTPVETSTPETENAAMNMSDNSFTSQSASESKESKLPEVNHTEPSMSRTPFNTPTPEMQKSSEVLNISESGVRNTPTPEKNSETQEISKSPISGFEILISAISAMLAVMIIRRG